MKGIHTFKAKVNIEVQWASEPVIAAVERNGGVITTAYYDMQSLQAMRNVEQFFSRGNLQKENIFIETDILHNFTLYKYHTFFSI